MLSRNDTKYLYNLACYAKALSTRNNSNLITIHYYLIVFSMYVYINNHFKGFFKLLLRLSTLTYYNLFSFIFCLYHYCYMMYMSVLKTMYYVHVWNKVCSVLFCSVLYKLYLVRITRGCPKLDSTYDTMFVKTFDYVYR